MGEKSVLPRIALLLLWGAAFGFVESSVVVYLRALYYPEGFHFPLTPMDPTLLTNEIFREAATLVMIAVTAILSFSRTRRRIGAFLVLFGSWDIFYYLFLKVVLDWPPSLETWDILFLIPVPWAAPVWAPSLIALTLIAFGIHLLLVPFEKEECRACDRKLLLFELVAGTIVLGSFILPGLGVLEGKEPKEFPALLYWVGYLLGLAAFLKRFLFQRLS